MNLTVINHNNQRILTTAQLATSYQTENKVISNNFNRNKDRYKEGKHYFALTDESKRQFINLHQIEDGSKNANTLYLWTEKGAWLHAKSLNTDAAWDAYEKLVDEYYSVVKVLSEREQLIASMKLSLETAEEINHIKNDLDLVKHQVSEELTLNHGQQQSLHHEIKKRVESIKNDYEMTTREIYSQIHSHLRRAFAAPKYVFVKRKDFEEAISWVKTWRPLI
ncbi:ORF6N domain-containing protein [Cytobacillus oceanisediminis]|uniref:ORF6N domain-containing protein n=1 Tax=Bacillaceae TaxID=186817 RepID=UPI001CCAFC0E|nr:ORF6N domain-containing protein [Cytobacillus oceanisediminis]MBZ9536507.1 ORF6N domain-containing protein [Cytobacillus oceanisediminis]